MEHSYASLVSELQSSLGYMLARETYLFLFLFVGVLLRWCW